MLLSKKHLIIQQNPYKNLQKLFSHAEVRKNAAQYVVWGNVAGNFAKEVQSVFQVLNNGIQSVVVVGRNQGVTHTFQGVGNGIFLAGRAQAGLLAFGRRCNAGCEDFRNLGKKL